ncbi:MAG: hypothetical protein GYA87_00620, partial [Christensenellaceae bacterium]|nr:hypothetical protein [Christensenellaceae bacterium]
MNYLFEKILKIVSGVILILISLSLLITGIAPNNFIINAKTAFDFINGGFSVLSFYSIFIIFLFVILFLSLGLLLLFSTASNSKERIKVLESNYGNVFVSQFVVGDLIKHCLTNYEGIKLKNYKLDYLNNNINLVLNVVLKTFL